ncbi:MAG: glycosyltransferase family 2 protein [Dysgonomonas sp.]|nr:glycosyltransferase family 2 protein [Dysgonomonas sp.]
MAKVSIITISYNNVQGLKKTIDSVLVQNFADYEYIVIDGGSTDGSKEILDSYSDRIDHWVSEPDRGVYHAMNKGIQVAKGEYLHFLNSGDIYADKGILTGVFSREYSVPLIRTVQICDYGSHKDIWTNLGEKEVSLYDMYTNTMLHQATFIRKDMFQKYGLYDESLKIVSDWKFFLKTIIGGEKTIFVNIQSIIFEMEGISTNKSYGELHLKERRQVLTELMPPNTIADYERLKEMEKDIPISTFVKSHSFYFFIFKVVRKIHKVLGVK